jgi:hypothetical protein
MAAERGIPPDIPASVRTRRRTTLARLAAEQFGVVSRRELLLHGFTSSAIGDLTADGTLHRVTHGVYAVGHRHLTREGWWSVAVRAGGQDALLSHRASTAVRGLLRAVSKTDTIVSHDQGVGLDGIRAHRCSVDPIDRDVVHGLPVTSLPRTMVDLAGSEPHRLVEALEQSIILGIYDHREMLAVLRRCRGRRGVARLRAAMDALPDDPARFRSRSERRARDLLIAAGLPEPRVNDWYVTGPGGGHELDLHWPGLAKNVEIDGPRHDLPWQQAKDRFRDADLRARGIAVQRHRVELLDAAPGRFVAEVGHFLAQRG